MVTGRERERRGRRIRKREEKRTASDWGLRTVSSIDKIRHAASIADDNAFVLTKLGSQTNCK